VASSLKAFEELTARWREAANELDDPDHLRPKVVTPSRRLSPVFRLAIFDQHRVPQHITRLKAPKMVNVRVLNTCGLAVSVCPVREVPDVPAMPTPARYSNNNEMR
jgi:hypothetical protein